RSPVSALERAHAVLVDDEDAGVIEHVRSRVRHTTRVFGLRRRIGTPVPLEPARPWVLDGKPVVAVAAIARPGRFVSALEAAGWTVARTAEWPDHHRYVRRDVQRIAAAVRDTGAGAALTT